MFAITYYWKGTLKMSELSVKSHIILPIRPCRPPNDLETTKTYINNRAPFARPAAYGNVRGINLHVGQLCTDSTSAMSTHIKHGECFPLAKWQIASGRLTGVDCAHALLPRLHSIWLHGNHAALARTDGSEIGRAMTA